MNKKKPSYHLKSTPLKAIQLLLVVNTCTSGSVTGQEIASGRSREKASPLCWFGLVLILLTNKYWFDDRKRKTRSSGVELTVDWMC